jgi:hypothetical protein
VKIHETATALTAAADREVIAEAVVTIIIGDALLVEEEICSGRRSVDSAHRKS